MDIRISHSRRTRETVRATGLLGALGAPGQPAGEEEIVVELEDASIEHLPAATGAMIAIINRDFVDAEIVDEPEEASEGDGGPRPF